MCAFIHKCFLKVSLLWVCVPNLHVTAYYFAYQRVIMRVE
jgi:hypothetical protein